MNKKGKERERGTKGGMEGGTHSCGVYSFPLSVLMKFPGTLLLSPRKESRGEQDKGGGGGGSQGPSAKTKPSGVLKPSPIFKQKGSKEQCIFVLSICVCITRNSECEWRAAPRCGHQGQEHCVCAHEGPSLDATVPPLQPAALRNSVIIPLSHP